MSATLDFTWSPLSVAITYTVGGDTYPYTSLDGQAPTAPDIARYGGFTTPSNTLITFVANVTTVGETIASYRWDFGDGTFGYGSTASHTFKTYAPQQQITLTVVNNRGRRYQMTKQLNLREASDIQTGLGLNV